VRVRPAVIEDARAVAGVHIASWRGAYPGLLPAELLDSLSLSGRERQWHRWLQPGGERSRTLVAESGDAVVGFSTLAIECRDADEPEGVGEIPALYVRPQSWGHGAGTALLDASIVQMRAGGCRQVILWMLEGNDRAAGFYAGHGWRADGGRRGSQYFPEVPGLVELRFRRAL
jgi:GNAT superfamily N-acetyltransferase